MSPQMFETPNSPKMKPSTDMTDNINSYEIAEQAMLIKG